MKLIINKNFILRNTFLPVENNIKVVNLLLLWYVSCCVSFMKRYNLGLRLSQSSLFSSHSNRLPYRISIYISSLTILVVCPTHGTLLCHTGTFPNVYQLLCKTIQFYNIHYLVFSRPFSRNVHLCIFMVYP